MSSHHRTLSRRALLALIFIVGYAFSEPGRPGAAQQAPQGAGAAALPPGVERLTSVEGSPSTGWLTGSSVLLFPDSAKETITVNVTYLVGSRHEGYGETGMAHLLEHLCSRGRRSIPNIAQELTDHGARPNGTTWFDRTNYFETFAATDENLRVGARSRSRPAW